MFDQAEKWGRSLAEVFLLLVIAAAVCKMEQLAMLGLVCSHQGSAGKTWQVMKAKCHYIYEGARVTVSNYNTVGLNVNLA